MPTLPKATPKDAWLVYLYDGEQEHVTYANGLVEDIPPRTVGEGGSWQFHFTRDGGPRSYDPLEHTDRYQRVQEVGKWADRYVLKEPMEEPPRYRERVPYGGASVLVGVRPTYQTPAGGIWGLVDSYDETNSLPESGMTVTLELTMLASMDDYADRDEVVAELSF